MAARHDFSHAIDAAREVISALESVVDELDELVADHEWKLHELAFIRLGTAVREAFDRLPLQALGACDAEAMALLTRIKSHRDILLMAGPPVGNA
jgi:hypothetical protein